jgi:hypothetical protein
MIKKQGSRAELQDREAGNRKARMLFQKWTQMSQAWLEPPADPKLWLGSAQLIHFQTSHIKPH